MKFTRNFCEVRDQLSGMAARCCVVLLLCTYRKRRNGPFKNLVFQLDGLAHLLRLRFLLRWVLLYLDAGGKVRVGTTLMQQTPTPYLALLSRVRSGWGLSRTRTSTVGSGSGIYVSVFTCFVSESAQCGPLRKAVHLYSIGIWAIVSKKSQCVL